VDEGEHCWLVPELLPKFQPELGQKWRGAEAIRLRYTYKVVPEGLIPRFITRTYPLSDGQLRWRQGVVLKMDGARALVRAAIGGLQAVDATLIGEDADRHRLAMLVRSHFARLNADDSRFDPQELVEVEGRPGLYAPVQTLEADEKSGAAATVATPAGSVPVETSKELDRISAPAARDPKRRRAKLFLSYAHKDHALRDVFAINLDLLKADGLVEWWYDGEILASADWDKEIRRELDETDIIVCLITTPFLASSYIRGVEMKRALERRAAEEVELVSVICENCSWKGRPFARYQMLFPMENGQCRRAAFNEVEQQLRRLIGEMLS
jgi:internalin A